MKTGNQKLSIFTQQPMQRNPALGRNTQEKVFSCIVKKAYLSRDNSCKVSKLISVTSMPTTTPIQTQISWLKIHDDHIYLYIYDTLYIFYIWKLLSTQTPREKLPIIKSIKCTGIIYLQMLCRQDRYRTVDRGLDESLQYQAS